ncbi:MAG: TerB family tellurite resistance protein [Woeseiaceae bacterium]|nr:TerB family tellurite resistance protein [Woeseiaceae bacterium]
MFKRLFDRVADAVAATDAKDAQPAEREHALRLATAVLMVEVARADHEFGEEEFHALLRLIEQHFRLTPDEANELANEAGEHSEEVVHVQHLTQQMHEHLNDDEKARVVSLLWKVAFADGRLHSFEDSLVLKISDLLYVSRGRVMRLKHDAELGAR